MPIVAAGITGIGDLIGGGLGALFGAADAGAAALGAGAAGAEAATAGTIGAADVGTTLGAGLGAGGAAGAIDTGAGLATSLAGPAAGGGADLLTSLGINAAPDALSASAAGSVFDTGTGAAAPFLGISAPTDAAGVTGTGADVLSSVSPVGTGTAMDPSIVAASQSGAVGGLTPSTTLPAAAGAAPTTGIDTTGGLATSLAGPPSTTAGGGGGSLLDTLTGAVAKNPIGAAGAAVGAGGLLYNLMRGQNFPAENALNAETGQIQSLLADFRSGKLPPAYQTAVQQATQAANAATISSYASRGQNTDPRYNSALARDLQANAENAIVMGAKLGETLLQGGLSAVQLDEQTLTELLNVQMKQSQMTGQAISNFATALGSLGGGGKQNITLQLNPTA